MTKRCPRCGQGKLFSRWFRISQQCPGCGLRFERDEGSRLGSAMVNYAFVGFLVVVYLAVSLAVTLPDPPLGALIVGGVFVVVVPALAFFPFAKTIWSAIDLVLHGFRLDEEERGA